MSLSDRRAQFEKASKADAIVTKRTKFSKLFGVSNSAKVISGGLQLGVVNLDNVGSDVDGFVFACTMVFPPNEEIYFTAYVKNDAPALIEKLNQMRLAASGPGAAAEVASHDESEEDDGAGEDDADPAADEESGDASATKGGKKKKKGINHNTVIVLTNEGRLIVRNRGFWDTLPDDIDSLGPKVRVDHINVAVYPPAVSAQRSLLAREFVGYLGSMVGREKVHELRVWSDEAAVSPEMRRMPAGLAVDALEKAVAALGGHYPGGEVRRLHGALSFLTHKHFVILSGLSGTGKTQLALKYARAVHDVRSSAARDPFIIVCPVRPEWTDPSGLTGYYDVLTDRYVVPPFLQAVLLATAHRESPVFVVLDEMNLARVEYYFSDVLSAIETGEPLQLHSSSVPLEGSDGGTIPTSLNVPENLFIIGTVNVDETTNPVSDKVLDRAIILDMSKVDLPGFLQSLTDREPALSDGRSACEDHLLAAGKVMQAHGLGFGYRVAEEVVRYHAFAKTHLGTSTDEVTDDLMVQKVLVKLRGSERQRPMLTGLAKALSGLPRSQDMIAGLVDDLDEFGSFQASR